MLLTGAAPRTARSPADHLPPRRWLITGVTALAVALAAYAADLLTQPRSRMLTWFDLRVYAAAGRLVLQAPDTLYGWQLSPGIRFTYTPFAALLFASVTRLPWPALAWLMTSASVLALGVTVWLTLGRLGWSGRRRLGMMLAVGAVAFWTEPVQRTLHLGQIELLLMALVVADLCQPGHRWWKGAGIGLAAGIKLVPLVFIPYLLLTRRFRQAAIATAVFAATAGAGFALLPPASSQWWFGPDFLQASRTGFIGFVANQSLRGMITRIAGSVSGGTVAWLVAAFIIGVAGLLTAAALHRAGWPVHGWLTCALTGLLVSPVSWDHHWVWIAPALAVIADAAVRAAAPARWCWWGLAAGLAGLFGGWPSLWSARMSLAPWGLIWYAPGTPGGVRGYPWYREYHWHGIAWLAGNLYVLAGLALLAALLAAASRGLPLWRAAAAAVVPSRDLSSP